MYALANDKQLRRKSNALPQSKQQTRAIMLKVNNFLGDKNHFKSHDQSSRKQQDSPVKSHCEERKPCGFSRAGSHRKLRNQVLKITNWVEDIQKWVCLFGFWFCKTLVGMRGLLNAESEEVDEVQAGIGILKATFKT